MRQMIGACFVGKSESMHVKNRHLITPPCLLPVIQVVNDTPAGQSRSQDVSRKGECSQS